MKVVGGPHDGMDVHVNLGVRYIKLIDPIADRVMDWLCGECGRAIPAESNFTVYTVRTLAEKQFNGSTEYLYFLAPEDWTEIQALRHQFSK